jgi:NitT/TauT family transport system substrate-binding protein
MKVALRYLCIIAATLIFSGSNHAQADQSEVKILLGKPLGYLTLQVMQYNHIFEKQAAAHGVPGLKVTYITNMTGGNAVDAILSGSVDIAQYSPDVLINLWSKTAGTPNEIRGIVAKGAVQEVLVTRNPNVHSMGDFTDSDRIAVGGVKTSAAAMWIEMATAKALGEANFDKLDHLTVNAASADGYAQLISPISQVTAFFAVPPFSYLALAQANIHKVLTSDEAMGARASSGVEFSTKKFHDANPKLIAAFIDAMKEAGSLIMHDRAAATIAYRVESGDTTTPQEIIDKFLDDPNTDFDPTPKGIMIYADFMYEHGLIKRKPASWKDVFFPEAYGFNGN